MTTTVQKWGNSLAVRLPKEVLENTKLVEGSFVEISSQNKEIVIRPAKKDEEYSLKELVRGITPQNRHNEISLGMPLGKEVW